MEQVEGGATLARECAACGQCTHIEIAASLHTSCLHRLLPVATHCQRKSPTAEGHQPPRPPAWRRRRHCQRRPCPSRHSRHMCPVEQRSNMSQNQLQVKPQGNKQMQSSNPKRKQKASHTLASHARALSGLGGSLLWVDPSGPAGCLLAPAGSPLHCYLWLATSHVHTALGGQTLQA
jgi:hypothetical protein